MTLNLLRPAACTLLLLLLLWQGSPTVLAAYPGHDQPVLIIQYADSAVAEIAAKRTHSVSTAAVEAAVAAADKAAQRRGASPHRRQAVVAVAAESAAAAPAVAAITTSLVMAVESSGIKVTGLTSYHTVMSGAALKVATVQEAAAIKKILSKHPAVKQVYTAGVQELVGPISEPNVRRGHEHHDHEDHARTHNRRSSARRDSSERDSSSSSSSGGSSSSSSGTHSDSGLYSITGVSKLRDQGLDGSGVLVCVVDTGINIGQPHFGECSAPNHPERRCKVVTGYNFVGDAYTGTRQGPPPVAGGKLGDCMGHGSQVASVVGTRNGVAPGVTLGAYRVFGCEGYVGDNVLIDAIDRAVRDGCDVINLSLASGSGYAETSIYQEVMRNAIMKGVIAVKAAGNSGDDGPFRADVATAVGAIAVASVDATSSSRGSNVKMSRFSSYGPNPTLDLVPHVSAPGGDVPVITKDGSTDRASGTSFAAPYTAGVIALWLQQRQQQAADAGVSLDAASVSHDAVLRGLVSTARGVPDRDNKDFLESVALMGAGVIQADAFVSNQLEVSPTGLVLPTGLTAPHTASFKMAWRGPPSPAGTVTYRVAHQPSVSIPLSDGWYGTKVAIKKVYASAQLSFSKTEVTIDTRHPEPVVVQVTFELPGELVNKRLLYSGLIKLVPTTDEGAIPAVTVPYQGFAAQLKHLRLAARRAEKSTDGDILHRDANALCYSPRAVPSFYFDVMDHLAKVPKVCTGGLARGDDDVIKVDFDVLHSSSECSLRVTLAPEVPLERLRVKLLDEAGVLLGSLEPLVPSSGGALAKVRQVMSYCTRFDGSYTDTGGRHQVVDVGSKYRLRVFMHGPVSLADMARKVTARVEEVPINGIMLITSRGDVFSDQKQQQQKQKAAAAQPAVSVAATQ